MKYANKKDMVNLIDKSAEAHASIDRIRIMEALFMD